MKMIGLQTYTIRKWLRKNPEDAIKRMNEMGIRQIEASRMKLDQKMIDLLIKYNIKVFSVQLTYFKLRRKKEKVCHFAKSLNVKYLIISVLPIWARIPLIGNSLFSKGVHRLIDVYHKEGFTLGFHHHAYEMKQLKDHVRLDYVFHLMDLRLKLVMDTYWVTKKKQDPVAIYKRYENRIVGIHLRDYGNDNKNVTISKGCVDFKTLVNTIDSKVYLVIEQNTKDPKTAIEEGLRYMEETCERKGV